MFRREGVGVEIFGGHNIWGVRQATADPLRGPAEVPPSGVGFCAACHPLNREIIPTHIGRAA